VAIAQKQTGIYSVESPEAGDHRPHPVKLFDPRKEPPCCFKWGTRSGSSLSERGSFRRGRSSNS
jgi:allophanate hydrolase subunit 1